VNRTPAAAALVLAITGCHSPAKSPPMPDQSAVINRLSDDQDLSAILRGDKDDPIWQRYLRCTGQMMVAHGKAGELTAYLAHERSALLPAELGVSTEDFNQCLGAP
jgi:hypothetical protein